MSYSLFYDVHKLYTEPQVLAAIWLPQPVKTATGVTYRIAPGHLVTVENNTLVDCVAAPTHRVIGCTGTLYNQFELSLVEIKNNKPLTLKL